MKLHYRADIDGLRAIAVLSVVFGHIGFSNFSGGYIGVDVFFVISGFLITAIIAREIRENEFTLMKFYERRIRRILPALAGMVIFTMVICALIYDAKQFKGFSKSLIATMLFASNINFSQEAGYFDAPSYLKPLLHTWSLAVEEQFYIIFPLLMIVLNDYVRKQKIADAGFISHFLKPSTSFILIMVALFSLGLAIYGVNHNPVSAFYLAHLRAWELLVGSLIALNIFPVVFNKGVNMVLGLIGIFMIGIPVFLYTESTPFPGLSAVPPVLGTALVIFSSMTEKSLVGKILSAPLLVFIGAISYSLYLWHWPLIVFAKYYLIRPMTIFDLWVLIVVIFGVSTASWRFIETPFRSKKNISTYQIYIFAAVTTAVMLLSAAVVYSYDGFPNREDGVFAKFKEDEANNLYSAKCVVDSVDSLEKLLGNPFCKLGVEAQKSSFILWGDSHAAALARAVYLAAEQNSTSGILRYGRGCPPLLGISVSSSDNAIPCVEYNNMMINYLADHPEITTVILASRWPAYVEDSYYKQEKGPRIVLIDTLNEVSQSAGNEVLVKLGLKRTIEALENMNRKVVMVAPIPEVGYDVPSSDFIALRTGRDINEIIAPSLNEYLVRTRKTFAVLNELDEEYDFQLVEPWKVLCVENICSVAIDGFPLYRDDDHLSLFGAEQIADTFVAVFFVK